MRTLGFQKNKGDSVPRRLNELGKVVNLGEMSFTLLGKLYRELKNAQRNPVFGVFCFLMWIVAQCKEAWSARKRRKHWIETIEEQYREHSGYPPDWEYRREEIIRRANGHCEHCDRTHGPMHVHHITEISRGGMHELSNLQLLCEDCHINKHPNNVFLKINRNRRKLYFGSSAKVTTARKDWSCALCEKNISPGQSYYGDQYNKICLQCWKKIGLRS